MFTKTRCISVFLSISTSIVQPLKLHLGNRKIAILLRPHSGDQCDSYPTTLYRPCSTLWRKGALIKTGKLPHISTKTRRAGKSLQMMSVQSSPDESSCWWAGWLMPAGSRGPPPEHCHRRCNTSQSDTAKFYTTNDDVHAQYSMGQSRPRFCPWPPPRTAVLAQFHFSRVAITSTFGTLLARAR